MKNIRCKESILVKCDDIIVNLLFATAFFLALSPEMTTVCLLTSAITWFVKLILTKGKCFRRTPFDKLILVFIILSFSSVFVSPDKGFSFYNYYNLMGRYILIYYLVIQNIITFRQLKILIYMLGASAVAVILYGFYQYIFGIDISNMLWVDGEKFPELKTRVFSTLQNPNILAGYLLVVMLIIFGFICKAKKNLGRLVLILFFLMAGTCLAMTYSRGAWISLLIVLTVYGVFKNKFILMPLIFFIAAVGIFDQSLTERFLSAFHAGDTSSNMRLGIWESTIAMILDHPLLGIGWGAFWMVYPSYDFFIQNDAVLIVHAHNMYLNFAAEIGVLGLLAFLAVMIKHINLALTSTNLRASTFLNGLTLGCGLSMVAVAINGFTDYVLFNIELSMLFWLVCAIIVISCRRSLD